MNENRFEVICPCCHSKVFVDHKTGIVISHEKPVTSTTKTFEQAVAANKRRKTEAEGVFAQAVREHENKDEILEKKFQAAFRKADKEAK